MNIKELILFVKKNKSNYSIQLKRHNIDLYNEIDNLKGSKFSEKLYRYIHGDEQSRCIVCGNDCKFDGFNEGFRTTCSYKCRDEIRKTKSHEIRECATCGNEFEVYKKRKKSCCSIECFNEYILRDEIKQKRLKSNIEYNKNNYGVDHYYQSEDFIKKSRLIKLERYGDETFVNPIKGKKTKKERYGDENYNNLKKQNKTLKKKYGVINSFHLPQAISAGKRISNFQRREYEKIKAEYPDALLEEYLPDVDRSVDIYIPSEKKIIECFGDYWHMNPETYLAEDYNKNIHKTAKEIWEFDNERIELFKNKGYLVEIIWESSCKL
jgi:hypothetical protein